jgi:hypothetical protein
VVFAVKFAPSKGILKKKVFHIFLLLISISELVYAQPEAITVRGNAVTSQGLGGLYQVIVINQHTSQGMMAAPNGYFSITCKRTDTILVSASGFSMKKICFLDSIPKKEYYITVRLDSLHYSLAEVKIYPHKNLREVDEEKKSLGDIPNTDVYKDLDTKNLTINDLQSPISYLYERFSRIEQSKRKVAELEDEDKRREVLKELFHIYIQHDIINLSDADFEKFIDYCNFTDDFIKNSSDYDLVMAIKYKYQHFEKMQDYVPPAGR